MDSVDLRQHLANTPGIKVFLAPNTSDQELVDRAKKKLAENGIAEEKIQVNYDTQLLSTGDLYISYDPPDLVVRIVYEKKPSGIVKMKSAAMIKL
jgi:hypothetical protein